MSQSKSSKPKKGTKRKISPADKVERLREEQRDILRAKGHDEKEVERQIEHIEEKYGARERNLEELMQKFEARAATQEIEELAKKHEIQEQAAKLAKTQDKKEKEKEEDAERCCFECGDLLLPSDDRNCEECVSSREQWGERAAKRAKKEDKKEKEEEEEDELVDGGTRSPTYDPYAPSAPGEEEVFYTPLPPVPMDEGEIEYAPTSPSHDPDNKNCGCSFCIVDAEEPEAKIKAESQPDASAPATPKASATTIFKQGICGITYANPEKMEWVIGQIRAGLGISPLLASLHLQPPQLDWGYTAGEPVIFLSNAIPVASSDRDRIQAEILAMGFAVYS